MHEERAGSRIETIPRRNLLRRLVSPDSPQAVILTAPAGSGKSTLLAQWAESERRPVAWLSCGPGDLDASQLVMDLARAIASATGPGPVADVVVRMHATDPLRDLTRLVRAMATEPAPALIVLDDVHQLRAEPESLDLVTMLVDQLPRGWTVAMAMRHAVALPLARWRALGESFVRIDVRDLALNAEECAQLLGAIGVAVTGELVGDVLSRTEGWPVGVYLAGLSLRSERPLRDGRLVAGDDTLIRSYLESEVLAGIDPRDHELLMRTSIVGEVSGPLAEAMTGIADAGERLYALSKTNLLVMSVDRQERWFRYHGLLADLLQRQLEDRCRDTRALHARAARWYEENGDIDNAVEHASLAREDDQVRRLVLASVVERYRDGHVATLQRWMSTVSQSGLAWDPPLALAAALIAALDGETGVLMRAVAAAGLNEPDDDPDPRHLDRASIRALLCPSGPELMRGDALRALVEHGDGWPWAPIVWIALGSAEQMLGNQAAAVGAFQALERTADGPRALSRLMARAERALDAIARRNWSEAEALLHQDRAYVVDRLDAARIPATLWLVADARLHVHRGDLRTARDRLRAAQLGRVHLSWALPWYAVRTLTQMAQVQLLVDDVGGARTSLAQAREILRVRPRLGGLATELEQASARALHTPGSVHGGSTLSPAELRLLPLLQTYCSFKEIGQRLSISANTVKTEAMSIYSKLGASTRSEAVERAVAAGLLEDPFA